MLASAAKRSAPQQAAPTTQRLEWPTLYAPVSTAANSGERAPPLPPSAAMSCRHSHSHCLQPSQRYPGNRTSRRWPCVASALARVDNREPRSKVDRADAPKENCPAKNSSESGHAAFASCARRSLILGLLPSVRIYYAQCTERAARALGLAQAQCLLRRAAPQLRTACAFGIRCASTTCQHTFNQRGRHAAIFPGDESADRQ